ncbi:hypothetical protein ACO0LC_01575 [Undibacterium sp. JH2W]
MSATTRALIDYQSQAKIIKNLTITGGVRNLFNVDPPFTIRNTGGN